MGGPFGSGAVCAADLRACVSAHCPAGQQVPCAHRVDVPSRQPRACSGWMPPPRSRTTSGYRLRHRAQLP